MFRRTRPLTPSRLARRTGLAILLALSGLVPMASPAGGAARQSSPSTSATCSLASRTETVNLGTEESPRQYHLRVPEGLNPARPAMLLLSLHPGLIPPLFGQPNVLNLPPEWNWEDISGWTTYGASHGFVVAYPQTVTGGENFTWEPNDPASADVAFVREVVQDITAKVCIDTRNIHIDGYSMGGWMAQRMACQNPEIFASASAGGALHPTVDLWAPEHTWPCQPSRPISMYISFGTEDRTVDNPDQPQDALNGATMWAQQNGCTGFTGQDLPPADPADPTKLSTAVTFTGCLDDTVVQYRTWQGYDHIGATQPFRELGRDERYLHYLTNPRP
jgi:polyhydroxybutyrate depolymerase